MTTPTTLGSNDPWTPPGLPARRGATTTAVGHVWPDAPHPPRRATLPTALAAGTLAAVTLRDTHPGLALLLVGLLVAATAAWESLHRLRAHELAFGALSLALLSGVVLRDAGWVVALSMLAAFGCAALALSGARTWLATVLSSVIVPLAGLRGLPWLRRGLSPVTSGGRARWWPVVRALSISVVLLLVFGALFSAADPVFGRIVGAAVPDLWEPEVIGRVFVGLFVGAVAVAVAFLAAAPPPFERLRVPAGRVPKTVEWVLPLALLDALFVLFLVVQAAALFGGREHVARTAGLTYAEYARQGFGQLVVVTLLTLAVVAVAARHAPAQSDRRDRLVVRGLLGALCALAVVVAVSALHRMDVYDDAFGATRARLLAAVIEIWLGAVLLLVLAATVRWSQSWLPRATVAAAGLAIVGLLAVDADALVAKRNVDRYATTGRIDVAYLSSLSADAVPQLDRLPEPLRSCALSGRDVRLADATGWGSANRARSKARAVLERRPVGPCDGRPWATS